MTTITIAPTEDDVFTALRAFLQDILPPITTSPLVKCEVLVGQENRVPESTQPNYVIMTVLRLPRLSTNFNDLTDLGLTARTTQPVQATIQLDIHGPQAFNNSNRISTLFRDEYATTFFEAYPTMSPLFADDPRQMPFAPGGEQQYEDRYIVEANLEVRFTVTRTAESAKTLTVGLIDVETPSASWPNSTVTATTP